MLAPFVYRPFTGDDVAAPPASDSDSDMESQGKEEVESKAPPKNASTLSDPEDDDIQDDSS